MTAHPMEVDGVQGVWVSNTGMEAELKSGDLRRQLTAMRDYLVHELSVHRCKQCEASRLKTGDTAALVLRLQKVIEDLSKIPDETKDQSEAEAVLSQREANAKKLAAGSRRPTRERRTTGKRMLEAVKAVPDDSAAG